MQTYIHYGYGFNAKLLTDEEFEYICQHTDHLGKQIELNCVSFTEGDGDKDWATIVLEDFGEIPNHGKMVGFSDLRKLVEAHSTIEREKNALYIQEMVKFNISRLIPKLEIVIYSVNY